MNNLNLLKLLLISTVLYLSIILPAIYFDKSRDVVAQLEKENQKLNSLIDSHFYIYQVDSSCHNQLQTSDTVQIIIRSEDK